MYSFVFIERTAIARRSTLAEEEIVSYSGDPNAFVIELFGLREDIDDR